MEQTQHKMAKKKASLLLALLLTMLLAAAGPVSAQAQEGAQYGQSPPEAEANGSPGAEDELATLSFELLVEGTPPAGTTFYGNAPVEGSFDTRVPLADPDGDGLYTGSTTINRFGPGPRPVPAGTEPVSLPIQILQGDGFVIKDFGLVRIDGDKTFSASVSFGDDPGGGQGGVIQGTTTSISRSVVLVEEDPSSDSGAKGYFTVTDQTEISRLVGGDALAPAAFEDLAVGQSVEATYAGPVAQSYPTQGNAASIVILGEEAGGEEETATLSFELEVEGEPPANAAFFGLVLAPGGMGGLSAPLTDPDGDGMYTGSVEVAKYGPGPRPVPPGTEPMSVPVQIVRGGAGVIKDFGLVKIDGDKTFRASVSFRDGNGGTDPGGANPGGTDDGGSDNGGSGGTGPGGIRVLPATGGALPIVGIAGAVLVAMGLLTRRVLR